MTSLPDDRVCLLLAERELDKMPAGEWAIKCLEAGFDTRNLRMLAAMGPNEWPSVVDDKYRTVLREFGWDAIPADVYLLKYARVKADQILADELDPVEGSKSIYNVLLKGDLSSDLGAWYDIDEMIWDQDHFKRTGEKHWHFYREPEKLVLEIKQACADLLGRTKRNIVFLEDTSFDEAETAFQDFLEDNGLPRRVSWIFAEDIIVGPGAIIIRTFTDRSNREVARKLFDFGKRRELGLAIQGFCLLNDSICAYLDLPQNDIEARFRSMSGSYLRFSIRLDLMEAKAGLSRAVWTIRKLFRDKSNRTADEWRIPFLAELSND